MPSDRGAVADEIEARSAGFDIRAESQDVVSVRLTLHGFRDTVEGRAIYEAKSPPASRGIASAARADALPSGGLEAQLVIAIANAQRERFPVREERVGKGKATFVERRVDPASEAAVKARIAEATGYTKRAMSVVRGASNHGRDGLTYPAEQVA